MLDEAFCLEDDCSTEFDISALLRMDTERRIKTLGEGGEKHHSSRQTRHADGNLPPLPGGDALYLQQQNYSLEALSRRDAGRIRSRRQAKQPQRLHRASRLTVIRQ